MERLDHLSEGDGRAFVQYLVQWERLVADMSTDLIRIADTDGLDHEIAAVLARLATYTSVDRAHVFLYDEQADTMSNTHEWCAIGIDPQQQDLQDVPASVFPIFMGQLLRLADVDWPRIDQLGAEASTEQAGLAAQGVKSLIAVPLVEGDRLLGCVSFDSVSSERSWQPEEKQLLRLSANLIASALVRVRTERELHHTRQQLTQTSKMEALGTFVGGTAHDFNNLLTVILSNCDLAEREEDMTVVRRRIDGVRTAAERAAGLTRSLLAFSRRQLANPLPFDGNALVADTAAFLDRIVGEKIEIELDLGPEAGFVFADPSQIEQVLLNLAANARDAMPEGGLLTFRTRQSGSDLEPQFVLEVVDSGVGMDQETIERAFDPFFTTKPVNIGTGLGLSSVHGIVAKAGGTCEIESTVGEGATVRICLPVHEVTEIATATADRSDDPADSFFGTVLLVEDDVVLLAVTAEVLESMGFDVIAVPSGEQALEVLRDLGRVLRLVVSDLVMPGLGGDDVVRASQGLRPEVPRILMSGYTQADIERLRTGLDFELLLKPFTAPELQETIAEALGLR